MMQVRLAHLWPDFQVNFFCGGGEKGGGYLAREKENIYGTEIYKFCWGEEKLRKKRRKIIGEKKSRTGQEVRRKRKIPF